MNPFFTPKNIDSGQKSNLEWVEESYIAVSDLPSRDFLTLSLSKEKTRIFLLILMFGLTVLLLKSFYLQVIKGDYYYGLAENNRLRTYYTKAHRGIIYDRNGKVLVQNVFGFSLQVVPAELPKKLVEKEKILMAISDILEIDIKDVAEKVKTANKYYFQPIVIETGIDYEKAMALKIASADLPGVRLEVDSWRHYLVGEEFSHLLGYVGKINAQEYEKLSDNYLLNDNIGKAGLELQYENYLKGEHGTKKVEVDALGREKKIVAQTPFIAGSDLTLTIDSDLQKQIFRVLKRQIGKSKAATVIVSNPQTGEILAMVDYPSYNNNLFATGISHEDYQALLSDERKPLFSRSILGEYPSGSIIKPLIAAAALEEKIITVRKSIFSTGGIWVADRWFFPDWKAGGHGATNIYKAIAQSVNTYFYYIGGGYKDFKGLGVKRIGKYLKYFGLGKQLGIDLPGEKSGLIPDPEWKQEYKNEEWYIGDTYHLAIGQGDILVTPLQVNSYNGSIANGGVVYQPYLVKEIVHPDDKIEMIMPKVLNSKFIQAKNIKAVQKGMRQAVTYGSAVYLYDLPVAVAGKTGTAQWHPVKNNHAWFIGFAPYNEPTFAITVLVEEGGGGDKVAVPIAKEILWWAYNNSKLKIQN